jgi:uncharacterized membrane protein YoaK (UPF0700 family)
MLSQRRAVELAFVLSLVAGSLDAITFGFDGLFRAQITGNLVVLAARIVSDQAAPVAHLISVPVFVAGLAVTRGLGAACAAAGIAMLGPLLVLQLLLLCGALAVTIAQAPADPRSAAMVIAGMLCVAAMAVQNALVQLTLDRGPSTAVMTTNTTRFVVGLGDNGRAGVSASAERSGCILAGFIAGCALGAACHVVVGPRAITLPTLALAALAMAFAGRAREAGM